MVTRDLLGLMSGTSMDGVDVARVRVAGRLPDLAAQCLSFDTVPYPPGLANDLRRLAEGPLSLETLTDLDRRVADVFADAAAGEIARGGKVAAVGSHGQTIFHRSGRGRAGGGGALTLQIGDGDRIAERLGVPVVSDFRRRDVAAGGEGAPLTPFADWVLLRRLGPGSAVLNLGGIANVTLLADDLAAVRAYDTGPANCLMDAAVRRLTGGREGCDRDGLRAARGHVDPAVLAHCLAHPYFGQEPPKSTGPELFSLAWLDKGSGVQDLAPEDLLSTLAEFTAQSIARSLRRFGALPARILAAGGGAANPELMDRIAAACPFARVGTTDEAGIPARSREAAAFAILAEAHLAGFPAGLPGVTGARRAAVLGKLSPGPENPKRQ